MNFEIPMDDDDIQPIGEIIGIETADVGITLKDIYRDLLEQCCRKKAKRMTYFKKGEWELLEMINEELKDLHKKLGALEAKIEAGECSEIGSEEDRTERRVEEVIRTDIEADDETEEEGVQPYSEQQTQDYDDEEDDIAVFLDNGSV